MAVTVSFLDAEGASNEFAAALTWAEEVRVHVAWGRPNCPLHEALLDHAAKVKVLRVGVDFMDTHPRFIEDWMGAAPAALRVVKRARGVFHPKVYCFDNGNERRVLIGSSNFTRPAFGANAEANTFLVGLAEELPLEHLSALSAPAGKAPTSAWLKDYRARWLVAQKARKQVDAKVSALAGIDNAFDLDVDFAEYREKLKAAASAAGHGFKVADWLRSLKAIRGVINVADPGSMSREQWRVFGGTPKSAVIKGKSIDLRFFGFIRGKEANRLLQPVVRKKLAAGLKAIPTAGSVTQEHFDEFSMAFVDAGFSEKMIGTASRLLSIWRPDRFAPCNRGSRTAFRAAVQPARLSTLRGYFDAHRLLWDLPWAKTAEPDEPAARAVWRARVALLDVLFYATPV